jgi:uncharacterized protein (DUF4213/DUF364 family)
MSIVPEILALTRTIHDEFTLPRVARVYVPPVRHDKAHADFGLVVLDDGSAGLFYVPQEQPLSRLREATKKTISGSPAWELARELCSDDAGRRGLAFGTVCAITQYFLKYAGYKAPAPRGMDYTPQDHVGMVGLFPTLVDRLRQRGIPLTVIEQRTELMQSDKDVQVTLNPAQLSSCNKILCTAATLLNDTIDDILPHCAAATWITVIGPSAGCLPDPLFERGVHTIGGSRVTDADALLTRMQAGEPWRDSVEKYVFDTDLYPGFATLRARAHAINGSVTR